MRAVVLGGAGAVCREATRDLAATSDFEEIVVADADEAAAEALVADLGDPRLSARGFRVEDHAGLVELLRGATVVVNGLPFRYDLAVTRAAIEAGVSGLDVGSPKEQFELHDAAIEAGVVFVPGVGATPGTTNLMVRRAAEVCDRILEVDIAFAAFRCLAPAPGLLATTIWEFDPEEPDRREATFEDGAMRPAPPLSDERVVRFHGLIGERSVFVVPHDEAFTLPRSFPDLRRVVVRGCFPPQVMEVMTALLHAGLLSRRPVRVGDVEVPSVDLVRELLASSPRSRENDVWAYGLVVEVLGERRGRRVRCTYRNAHPSQEEWGGRSAYFKNVGIPLSIGAQLIASGEVKEVGVLAPEQALPTEPFFAELARRGIRVEEEIVEEGPLA